jgi:hypothetical protein
MFLSLTFEIQNHLISGQNGFQVYDHSIFGPVFQWLVGQDHFTNKEKMFFL